jgi:hypothetical protein
VFETLRATQVVDGSGEILGNAQIVYISFASTSRDAGLQILTLAERIRKIHDIKAASHEKTRGAVRQMV